MKTMTILIYRGKYNDEYYLVDTPEQFEAVQRRLFEQLDQWGCYRDTEEGVIAARAGSIRDIRWLLDRHCSYEYEGWDIEKVSILEDSVPSSTQRIYDLATILWYRLVDKAGGHPGVVGSTSENEPWDLTKAMLAGTIRTLEEIIQRVGGVTECTG